MPQQTFETFGDNRLGVLMRTCEPALKDLVEEAVEPQLSLALDEARVGDSAEFISNADFAALPPAHQKMVQQAIGLFHFLERKAGQSLAPVFVPILGPLDEASKAVMLKLLADDIPTDREAQRALFEPDVSGLSKKDADDLQRRARDLKRTLVDHNGTSPIGLLRWCLQSARESKPSARGILAAVKQRFSGVPDETYKLICRINTFRNDYIAHQNKELTDPAIARTALMEWATGLRQIWKMRG